MSRHQTDGAVEYCASCRQQINFGDPVPSRRFRVWDPTTAQEIKLRLHAGCARRFVAEAEQVLIAQHQPR